MAPRFFSLANVLSLSRLPLGVAFIWALDAGGWALPILVLSLAGASDALDGWFARRSVARRTGGQSIGAPAGMGSWLDPLCDKLFVSTVLGALWFHYRPPLGWLALILARELAQLPLSLVYLTVPPLRRWLRYDFRASWPGKAATVLQFCAIVGLIFRSRFSHALAFAAFAVGMLALADYILRAVRMGRQRLAEEDVTKRRAP